MQVNARSKKNYFLLFDMFYIFLLVSGINLADKSIFVGAFK